MFKKEANHLYTFKSNNISKLEVYRKKKKIKRKKWSIWNYFRLKNLLQQGSLQDRLTKYQF